LPIKSKNNISPELSLSPLPSLFRNDLTLRPLGKTDHSMLIDFLQGDTRIHRHLDWRPPVEWLGTTPFWAMEKNGKIEGLIASPDDPPGVYWVRLFACKEGLDLDHVWKMLFEKAWGEIQSQETHLIAALAYEEWFNQLLKANGWVENQRVVLLKYTRRAQEALDLNGDYLLRPMVPADLDKVAEIDQRCFEPLWQQSRDATRRAFVQSSYSTVVEFQNEVIGYQVSTTASFNAHLARLAVLPEYRGKRIGSTLVQDMLYRFNQPLIREITVNTQQDNENSQSLYLKLGFEKTGESFPIFVYSG
jgi:ribosomal-protein-alanine N-acetyltransferase